MLAPTRPLALLASLSLLLAVVGCGQDDGPEEALTGFLTAWSAGDHPAAAALTDDPPAAAELLSATRDALAPVGLAARSAQVRTADDRATASVDLAWDLGQGRAWRYLGEVELTRGTANGSADADRGWRVRWAPTVVHPELAAGQRLERVSEEPTPAPVVDRGGAPLLAPARVVTVLLDRRATGDVRAVVEALARALSPLDPAITAASIAAGAARTPDGQAYPVAVLRDPDYQRVKPAIYDLPGLRFTSGERLLAPDADFARSVLPAVRTEAAAQLDGVPGWSVLVTGPAGAAVRTLAQEPPRPGTAVAVGLDRALQTAAEDVLEPVDRPAALVAVSPSTGDLLAVAQNDPADAQGSIALSGRYPPGSTFKIATATAAITEDRLTAASAVVCPPVTAIGGRSVPNADRLDLGAVPLRTAFARSCNTTFAELAARLDPTALPDAALALGLGADYEVPGLVTVTGSVPAATDPVQRAENGIGQGTVLASPFGLALVAATVARGSAVVPQLITDRPTRVLRPAGTPDAAVLDQLRPMMRAVVTEGTAVALRGQGELFGKTGTAEFTADGRAHGWFVGYRGDLAVAVLVVDGGSSGPAVDVAGRFLDAAR